MKRSLKVIGRGKASLVLFGLIILCAAGGADAAGYRVTDLGDLAPMVFQYYTPTSINLQGEVVGYASSDPYNWPRAFHWKDGVMTDLGTLQGFTNSYARRINNAGQIIGTACNYNPGRWRAFLWENGVMTDLGTLDPNNYGESHGYGLNQAGQVVGGATTVWGTGHAFLYEKGKAKQDLTPDMPYMDSDAWAINDLGHVVGRVRKAVAPFPMVNVLWKNGGVQELGLPPGGYTDAMPLDINNAGQVLVRATGSDGKARGFIWQNGAWTDLGLLPGGDACGPRALNNLGQVVGTAAIPISYGNYQYMGNNAFLWQNGVLQNLNELIPPNSGVYLGDAGAINDLGQIAAAGGSLQYEGQARAFLLTPVPKDVLGPAMLLLQ